MNSSELYRLLPAFYRTRDSQRGGPLQSLMSVIDEQRQHIQRDIEQLYDDWFIETCSDALVPFLGELVGFKHSHSLGEATETSSASIAAVRAVYPRREVSRSIDTRRRKGTLPVFEDLSLNIAGLPARAVLDLNTIALSAISCFGTFLHGVAADLKAIAKSEPNSDPAAMQAIDLRHAFEPHNISVYLWRREPRSASKTVPTLIGEENGWRLMTICPYSFDMPLVIKPEPMANAIRPKSLGAGESAQDLASAWQLKYPTFLLRGLLEKDLEPGRDEKRILGKSISIQGYKASEVKVATLSKGLQSIVADTDKVYIDPEAGRIAVHQSKLVPRITCHTAVLGKIGGGEYSRVMGYHDEYPVYRHVLNQSSVARGPNIKDFVIRHPGLRFDHGVLDASSSVGWELAGSAVISTSLQTLNIGKNATLEIRAANKSRPILRVNDHNGRLGKLTVNMASGSRLVLDGIGVIAAELKIVYTGPQHDDLLDSQPCETTKCPRRVLPKVYIRHSTLAPMLGASNAGDLTAGQMQSIGQMQLCLSGGFVSVKNSIIAGVSVSEDVCNGLGSCPASLVELQIHDSIAHRAIEGFSSVPGLASLECARSTLLGAVQVHQIESATDSVFCESLVVERQQHGYLRFCYAPTGPMQPRRYKCVSASRPVFVTEQFGRFGYGQLAVDCPTEISCGAESESEMGAFHDLFESQRLNRLRTQLAEFTPADMTSTLHFADERQPGLANLPQTFRGNN